MSDQEIDAMPAGREIDFLIEAAIHNGTGEHPSFRYQEGVTEDGSDGWSGMYCSRCGAAEGTVEACALHYSTNIAAAWLVLEELKRRRLYPTIYFGRDGYQVVVKQFGTVFYAPLTVETAPLAICRAALKALTANGP